MDLRAEAEAAIAVCKDRSLAPTEFEFARAVILTARLAGARLATAESLTGGMAAELLTAIPGASEVFRGAVVAYATELKESLLGVNSGLLSDGGPVQARVAEQMAAGAAIRLGARYAVACTGVAGPTAPDGHEVGEVHIALAHPGGTRVHSLQFDGSRDDIRVQTCIAMFGLLLDALVPEAGLG